MAGGQGSAGGGHTAATLKAPLFVRIHDLRQAEAALQLERAHGRAVVLVTAAGMAAFAGVGFWQAVAERIGRPVVIDAGEDAGLVMAALRAGCRDLLFTGPEATARRLASMAAEVGARLRRNLAGEVLTLSP